MFTWIDGHLILMAILCPIVALLIVGNINAHLVRRRHARRSLQSYWDGVEDYRPDYDELEADLNTEDYR